MLITGTKNADVLNIKFGDTVTALGGADTINVTQADDYGSQPPTIYGVIDGGAGIDTLVLKAPATDSSAYTYTFSELRSVEKLSFTNTSGYDVVQFLVKVPVSASGTVVAGPALAIAGSAGGNEVSYKVTGGMGSANAITLPKLTFTAPLATQFSDHTVNLTAGDSSNHVLRASDSIGRQGIKQDLYGNAGNDTLIGSVGNDSLVGGAGADAMHGKGGDDVFFIFGNDPPAAGDMFDGGAGVDFLYVIGAQLPVTFAGTLVSIEGIRLGSFTQLSITANQMAMLPSALTIDGGYGSTLDITDANTFSAAKFDFIDLGSPAIAISGTAGADIITGSSGVDTLIGAGGADRLTGGAGSDRLFGGDGADILTGGSGADAFVFDTISKSVARDAIMDFKSAEGDFIQLDTTIFAGISSTGDHLTDGQFYAAAGAKAAHDADDRVIYNTTSGLLYYDGDGLGGQAAVAFALLKGHPVLAAGDIVVL